MQRWTMAILGLIGVGLLAGDPAQAQEGSRRAYEGLWGSNQQACRDEDGVDRMEITGHRFFWYETRCEAREIRSQGGQSWTLRMACQGEGQRFSARPRIILPSPDRLVMERSPVGPTRRQTYVRCIGSR